MDTNIWRGGSRRRCEDVEVWSQTRAVLVAFRRVGYVNNLQRSRCVDTYCQKLGFRYLHGCTVCTQDPSFLCPPRKRLIGFEYLAIGNKVEFKGFKTSLRLEAQE